MAHHILYATSVSVLAYTCTYASVILLRLDSTCSAECLQLQCNTLKVQAQSAQGMFFGTLAFNKFVSLPGFQHHKMYSHYLCMYVYLPTHVLLSQVFSLNISWLLILHTNHTICINNEFVILLNSILHILCFEHIVAIAYVLY